MRSAREPPGGDRDAARQHHLERADRRELLDQRGLEGSELVSVLLRQHDVLLRAQAVLEGILRRARLAGGGPGAAPPGPGARLCRARAGHGELLAGGKLPAGAIDRRVYPRRTERCAARRLATRETGPKRAGGEPGERRTRTKHASIS